MPWFKIDDSSYFHPKFRRAGNAALGLWVRCGSYSAQQLLEGVVPGEIAKDFGTASQAAKLVKVGLWHSAGHDCDRCPQPGPDDYVMHDFFEGGRNTTKAQVVAGRKAAAERQAKARAAATETNSQPKTRPIPTANTPQNEVHSESECTSNDAPNDTLFSYSAAGQDTLSQRDALGGVTTSQAKPSQTAVSPYGDTAQKTASYAGEPTRIGDRPRIPINSQPLVAKMTAAGLIVGWDLTALDWFTIEALIKRVGIDALVVSATASWQNARKQPRAGNYFLPAWRQLADAPAPASYAGSNLPATGAEVHQFPDPSQHRAATSDLRANQAIEAGRRLQAIHDAQRTQESS